VIFYLGVPEPSWTQFIGVPVFLSRNRLIRRVGKLDPSPVPWAMDSGGFTEITQHGGWRLSAREYAREADYFAQRLGHPDWAAPQDWMCEDVALKKTGLTLREHQRRTTRNFLELRARQGRVRFIPVLQGREVADYLRHVEDYARAGIDLRREKTVGVGSVCRRKGCNAADELLRALAALGLKLHAFGLSSLGLRRAADVIVSADSMAWSDVARVERRRAGEHKHAGDCRNCPLWALEWRDRQLAAVDPRSVTVHPDLDGEDRRLARAERARWTSAWGSVRRKRAADPVPLQLAKWVAEASALLDVNDRLDEEDAVEEERGTRVAPEEVPPRGQTRWELPEATRRAQRAIPDNQLDSMHEGARNVVREALRERADRDPRWPRSWDEEGAARRLAGPAPTKRDLETDAEGCVTARTTGRTFCPERCTPRVAARLLNRRGRQKALGLKTRTRRLGTCTTSDAAYALRWGSAGTAYRPRR
jgi:hypothetical protein